MLDIKRIRENKEEVIEALKKRGKEYPIDEVLELDESRREKITEVEDKKAERNKVSKDIPALKKEGKDIEPILEDMRVLGEEIKELDEEVRVIDEKLRNLLLEIPNTPADIVNYGVDDSDNEEIRRVGTPREFDFEPKAHWDLGNDLDILDTERATKISGSRFNLFKGKGAKLERALTQFMLDTHTENGEYTEVSPPFIVNTDSMIGTGQLPKFKEDMFYVPQKDMYLVPTAEVPVTNLHRDEILDIKDLPIKYVAYTPCFRAEAGSAGRDTRGLIRNHQFDKVELVKFTDQESSFDELDSLLNSAESILKKLEIPYRVVRLSGGDLGFSSAITYDIEVWLPSYNNYVEISSCSNYIDFQARRMNIRYRDKDGNIKQAHTLNGSGLAVGRTFAAVIENYQNEDGTITIPEVLKKYLPFDVID